MSKRPANAGVWTENLGLEMLLEKESLRRTQVAALRDIAIVVCVGSYFWLASINVIGSLGVAAGPAWPEPMSKADPPSQER
jgi:hypothetical protein